MSVNEIHIVVRADNKTKPVLKEVEKDADKTATSVADSFRKLDKPLLGAGAVAGGVFALALGSAVGAGLATIGEGALLLRENPAVVNAATSLGATAADSFGKAAEPMAGSIVTALSTVEDSVRELQPQFQQVFSTSAKFIQPLTNGLMGLIENVLPGFTNMLRQSQPIFDQLEESLPEIGTSLGNVFEAVGSVAPSIASQLGVLLDVTSLTLDVVAELIRIFGPGAGAILLFVGALKLVGPIISGITAVTRLMNATMLATPWGLLAAGALGLGYALGSLIDELTESEEKAGTASGKFTLLDTVLANVRTETVRGFASMIQYNTAVESIIANVQRATRASIGWEESLDQVTESVKRNGRTLDINTEKGRANATALLNSADAAVAVREANIKSGMSAEQANKKYQEQISRLYGIAKNAGFAESELTKLIGQYDVKIVIRTTLTGAAGALGLGPLSGILNGMNKISQKASGGIVGGMTLLGEDGAELVNLPQGSTVYPAGQSQRMMNAAGAGQGGELTAVIRSAPGADSALMDALLKLLRIEVRTTGRGSVDVLLEATA